MANIVQLSAEQLAAAGIKTGGNVVDNQDIQRFPIAHASGAGAAIFIAGKKGGWQNAHHSEFPKEFVAVQQGWIAIAILGDHGALQIKVLKAGESMNMQPGCRHNTFMSSNSILIAAKYGDVRKGDWHADPDIDALTKHLTEDEILEAA